MSGDKRSEVVNYLRSQAFWAAHIAEKIERGEQVDDLLWTSDLGIADKLPVQEIKQDRSGAA